MLTLTDLAVTKIRDLLDDAGLADGSGLRIARGEDHPGLTMGLVDAAAPEDVVVGSRGVAVFLEPAAAARLDEQVLDLREDTRGSAFFLAR